MEDKNFVYGHTCNAHIGSDLNLERVVQVSVLLSAKYSTALGPNFTASFIPGQEASGPAILEGFQTAEKRNILPKLPLGMLNIYFVRCIFF